MHQGHPLRVRKQPVIIGSDFDVFDCIKRLDSVAVSISYGPEKLGMHPDAATMLKEQMGAMRRVYDLLPDRTGIEVPDIEELLSSHP